MAAFIEITANHELNPAIMPFFQDISEILRFEDLPRKGRRIKLVQLDPQLYLRATETAVTVPKEWTTFLFWAWSENVFKSEKKLSLGERLRAIRTKIVASGIPLLDQAEIEKEKLLRRGGIE